ncbi:unnamed protein product [Ectocarpus sp. 12 AP-2014]
MILLLAWTTYFGAGTLRRCKDWRSERTLFESAFKVCPDGIKTLNNLAVGMLNVKEAGRAEELLRRAVELHPDFGFAQFNLGVSLMIQRDHLGAVSALERSLRLEPSNTKVMVYLGQVTAKRMPATTCTHHQLSRSCRARSCTPIGRWRRERGCLSPGSLRGRH